jgi:SAM-dependent methyltransferase
MHDFRFLSGERQTAATYAGIRADHRARYEWADAMIAADGFGLDAFCGNGYGAWLLSRSRTVFAVDGSAEAVAFADEHFKTPRTFFSHACYPFELPAEAFDFVVSMESIEHVEDGVGFFRCMLESLRPGGMLAFSTPCEEELPLTKTGNPFHHRHFGLEETLELASSGGLEIVSWAGQDCYQLTSERRQGNLLAPEQMLLKPRTRGQFTVVLARKRVGLRARRWRLALKNKVRALSEIAGSKLRFD